MNLFNKKYIARQIAAAPAPDSGRLAALRQWAADIASGKIATHSEVSLHGPFVQKVLVEGLGYLGPIGNEQYNVTQEQGIIRGSVDVAIGQFAHGEGRIIAPFELKGADTKNLDAVMPGRAKTPVDQVWEYATNNAGSKWVLISNYLEIRLYAYGEGRQEYERFDLARLHEPAEFARTQLLLSAENLAGGRTAEMLAESKRENKDITDRLYADYKLLRIDLIGEVRRELPDLDPLEAIRISQKILDRVLFIAFAEDRSLLPRRILERAFETTNAFAPAPVWTNFLGLFRAIDAGSPPLQVPRYNGGLFAPDAVIEALRLPDHICAGFKRLSDYDFASEVSVTVLGHIFEQSIADVEQLQAEARGEVIEPKKASGTSGRRKRDGVVYTPDYIARFIVEQTLGTHCTEIFGELLAKHARKGATPHDDPIAWKSKASEKTFWHDYRQRISELRIVDPACGSGVFLVMAFDWLKAELTRCNLRLEELGEGALFEVDSEILTHNLFGVDVNEESVEIAKLSLWIKTARHGKVLDSLDENFRVGDSLIEDSSFAYRSHGFIWREAFKVIFAKGGFDIVLGNPPYVRMEYLKDVKPYLSNRFEVVSDRADLYAYFFERGVNILKPGGRLGFISSSTFFKTGSSKPLRNFLRNKTSLETIVDFGDHKVFEGVTTYPAILTMRAGRAAPKHNLRFWIVDQLSVENFSQAFKEASQRYPQSQLGSGSWQLEADSVALLRAKILSIGRSLGDELGPPILGVKTGRDEPFLVSRETADALAAEHPTARTLFREHLVGDDLERWFHETPDRVAIYIKKGAIDISQFPSIERRLLSYKASLESRATKQQYFEWQQAQGVAREDFSGDKIVYPLMSQGPKFSIDKTGSLTNQNTFVIKSSSSFILALLNSSVTWFLLSGIADSLRGGVWRLVLKAHFVAQVRIPPASEEQKAELSALAEAAQVTAEERYRLQQEIVRRIPDLAPGGKTAKLSERLKAWWDLPNFAAFHAEVKKALKGDIPLKERNEWESWISQNRVRINALTEEIARIEREINAHVYVLFGLTCDEIALLEANV